MLRVTGYVLRFLNNLKAKRRHETLKSKYLMAREISEARNLWIKDNQHELCGDKYNELKVSLNLQRDENS